MIVKELIIDGKKVRLAASASIPRIYRNLFQRDIIVDMQQLEEDFNKNGARKQVVEKSDGKQEIIVTPSTISSMSLEIFENVAYCMAYHANNSIPKDIYKWLNQFDTFSIYRILPEILKLWRINNVTHSKAKKK